MENTITNVSRQSLSVFDSFLENRLKRGALLFWAALLTLSAASIHLVGLLKQPPQSGLLVALMISFTLVQAVIAVTIVALPARRLLLAAALIEVIGMLFWVICHTVGLADGFTVWHPETLNMPDFYLPVIEGVSACFLLYLAAWTWRMTPRTRRVMQMGLPALVLAGLLLWVVLNLNTALLTIVILILDAELPTSLQYFFLPGAGLLVACLFLYLILPRFRVSVPGAWRTMLALLPALLLVNLITWTGCIDAATTAWFPTSPAVHAPAGQTTTLEYCTTGSSPLAMDLSEPSAQATRPAPVVFYIHGGEGLQGSRLLTDEGLDSMYFTQFRDELVKRGFVVGAIDYGLFPQYHILDEIKNAKCAVRFLRAHAADLGIDPQRIGVYGFSMGGYISAMLGTVGSQAGFDTGQYMDQSSRVEAVIDISGPSDLTNFSGSPNWVSAIGRGVGSHGTKPVSPVNYVASGDPPFLIIHGVDDWFIAPRHSQDLARLLHAAGVSVTLVMVQHDGHGLAAATAGQIEQPAPQVLIKMMENFFVRTLAR